MTLTGPSLARLPLHASAGMAHSTLDSIPGMRPGRTGPRGRPVRPGMAKGMARTDRRSSRPARADLLRKFEDDLVGGVQLLLHSVDLAHPLPAEALFLLGVEVVQFLVEDLAIVEHLAQIT